MSEQESNDSPEWVTREQFEAMFFGAQAENARIGVVVEAGKIVEMLAEAAFEVILNAAQKADLASPH